jgi:hypothetical protein
MVKVVEKRRHRSTESRVCAFCSRPIEPGEKYVRLFVVAGDQSHAVHYHVGCENLKRGRMSCARWVKSVLSKFHA